MLEILKAVLFGIVEGITEWLPISSTGHMILLNEFVTLEVSPEFWEVFLVVIQLGAILAVVVLFWNKIFPFELNGKKRQKHRRHQACQIGKGKSSIMPLIPIDKKTVCLTHHIGKNDNPAPGENHNDISDHLVCMAAVKYTAGPCNYTCQGKHKHKNHDSFYHIAVFLKITIIFHACNSCFLFFAHCAVFLLLRSHHRPSRSAGQADV